MIKKAIYIGLFTFGFLSCSTSDEECCGTDVQSPVTIEADITGNIKSGFVSGDRIGVFPVEYVDGVAGILGDVRNPLNVEYVYDGRYWSAVGNNDIILEANMTDLYAYYPYDPQMSSVFGKTDLKAYPFSLAGNQADMETDFLWAKTTGITEGQNRTLLVFEHLFSQFIINLDYNEANPVDPHLEIYNTMPNVTIDLEDGSVTRMTGRETITPVRLDNPADGYDLSYTAIVAPGFIAEGTPIFSMDTADDTSLFTLSSDVQFRAGYTYTFNIILGSATTEPETESFAFHVK